ncbi:protein ORF129 [Cyprinid herpesvirus 3]|nr:protein ORF129 [Cyprinid herpesvirus 3]
MAMRKCCRGLELSPESPFPAMPSMSRAAWLLDWKPRSKAHREVYRFGRHCWLMGGWLSSHPDKGRKLCRTLRDNNTRQAIDLMLDKVYPKRGFPPARSWWSKTGFPLEGRVKPLPASTPDSRVLAAAIWVMGWHCMRHARLLDEEDPPEWCADRFVGALEKRVNACETPSEFLRFAIALCDGEVDYETDCEDATEDDSEEDADENDPFNLIQAQGFWAMGKMSRCYRRAPTTGGMPCEQQWRLGKELVEIGHLVMAMHMSRAVGETLRLNHLRPNLGTLAMLKLSLKYSDAAWDGSSSPNRSPDANEEASLIYTTGGEMVNVGFALCAASHRNLDMRWPDAPCWRRCATWYGCTVILTSLLGLLKDEKAAVTLTDSAGSPHTAATIRIKMTSCHYYGADQPVATVNYGLDIVGGEAQRPDPV